MKTLEFVDKVETTLETFGLVRDNVAEIGLNPANIAGDKLIFADLYNEQGKVLRAYCTPNVSADVRKNKFKTMTEVRAYLADKQLIETENAKGEVRLKISHIAGETQRGKIDKAAPKKVVAIVDEIPW